MKKFYITFGVIVVSVVAWFLLSPIWTVKLVDDVSPVASTTNSESVSGPKIISEGNFVASAHDVAGKTVIIDINGKKILRFEDFDTINGPDLRIYLSKDNDASDIVDLGAIRGTKGNINYDIPDGVDVSKYNHVLVWCRAFRVLFSYAVVK